MALHHLLFRCPLCGHDPTQGERDAASCPECGTSFTRLRKGGEIQIVREGSEPEEARVEDLMEKIEAFGGALSSDTGADGRIRRSAQVRMQVSGTEEPLRFRGSVLGFVEQLSDGENGVLHLQDTRLIFEPAGSAADASTSGEAVGESVGKGAPSTWDLLDIKAVQSASAAVQISPDRGGVVQFRFDSDSPFRWEALLKGALQKAYAGAGRGMISEFQPRIVSG